MFILLGLVNNVIVINNPMQFEAERQLRMLSFHTEPALATLFVCVFKVQSALFSNIACKGFIFIVSKY